MLRSPLAVLFFAFSSCFVASFAVAQERRPVDVPPRSRVFGRVVDGQGKPLADVVATLRLVDDQWAPGVEVPTIRWRGYDVQAFQTRTSSDGRFEFDVVTPTADWVSLVLESDVYHDIASRDFGPAGGRDQPRLLADDNDLGVFELAATGAIAGRVLDEKKRPIASAEVRLDDSFPGGMGRQTLSDASGAFTIEHVPAGKYGIEALRDGFKIAKSSNLVVAINATTASGDLVLAISPTISGVVVDEQGKPIANARVWGWPEKSGTGCGSRTDAQGRFSVALKQAEPHRFEVEADGFAKLEAQPPPFGNRQAHAVGATDVRLVMKRSAMTTFVVIDGATGQPVTRYAVALAWRPIDGSERFGGEPVYELADHAQGEFTCAADPELFDYVVTAPGYGPGRGPVAHESPSSLRCVVKLPADATLRGRVMLDGKPVRAEMLLYEGSLQRYHEDDGGTGPVDEQNYFWSDYEGYHDLVFVLPRPTKHWTDADGVIALAGLAAGEYRLEIWGPGGARKSFDPLPIAEGRSSDLADIELVPGATLEGELIVPAGFDPTTIQLSCWSMCRAVRARVNADRSFRFEGAAAGEAHILVETANGFVKGSTVPQVELAAGQTQRITIDLTDRVSVAAKVRVLVNGKPARGVRVFLQSVDGRGGAQMKDTDEAGVSTGDVRALGLANVILRAPSGSPLGTFEKQIDLSVGTRPEATIQVSVGSLELEWPALRVEEPLYLVQLASQMDGKDVWFHAMPGFDPPRFDAYVAGKNTARFDWILPGEREWTIEVQTVEDEEVQRNHTFRRKFAIKAGETTRVELTERDRVQKQ